MSGKRFRARAKKLQKLGRDGLVERNMSTGEETRVSQRTADISFGPNRTAEQAAGHHAAQRGGGDPAAPAKKQRKQPRPIQQTAEEAAYATQAPASAPEVPIPDSPSMRMAADSPMLAPTVTGEDTPPPPPVPRKRRQRDRKKSKRRQAAKHTLGAAQPADTGEQRPTRLMDDGSDQQDNPQPQSEPLPFAPDDRDVYKRRQAAKFAAHSAAPVASERRRLQFEDGTPPQAESPPIPAPKENTPPPSRKYEKAVRRVEQAEKQAEQARAALPVKRCLSIQPEPDSETDSAIPGTPGGPAIPDYPGEPPTDETFAAMLAEAEKYLGYPYVWGGSSPSTSFDCSGFVSWVINHSGWSVGRQTATGLYNLCTPVSMENAKPGDTAYGFLSRGCCRNCGFCIVSAKEGRRSVQVADLSEFWDGQWEIKLLDPNLLACPDHEKLLIQLAESRAWVDFTQGLDIRLITPDNVALLNRVRTKAIHFAWDSPDIDLTPYFRRFLELTNIRSVRRRRVYVLTNYGSTHEQDLYRVETLWGMGYEPYVMIYDRPSAPAITRQLQRWVNNKRIFHTVSSFSDYIPGRIGGVKRA